MESQQNPRNGVYRILRSNETFVFYKPDFSPDGKRILVGCYVLAERHEDICMLDLRGRRVTRVVSTPGDENFPVWSS